MNVRPASSKDIPAWEEYVLNHPLACPYHRFAWMHAIEQAYGFQAAPLVVEEHGRLVGLLPLTRMRGPLMSARLVSLPYCDAAGPLADTEEARQALLETARSSGKTDIRAMHPFADVPAHPTKVRMLLELPGSSEALLRGFKAKLRSQVKKPSRDGLSFNLGNEELFVDFYAVWSENMRDIGSPAHSAGFLRAVVRGYGTDAHIGLVRMPDGSPAAAGMVLTHGKTMYIPWASSLRRYNRGNPNMLLYWGFLAHAADKGMTGFDFGRSTPGGNTFRFKMQWGAQPAPLYWQGVATLAPAVLGSVRESVLRRIVAAAWRRLPVPLATGIGALVRKSISL